MTEQLLQGLHHITATVGNAREDYAFYTRVLGLRLVKQTVNFDFPQVYHLYYGDEAGDPGTIFTTFPYQGQGIRRGLPGPGQVVISGFSIPQGSLDFWRRRLETHGFGASQVERFGQKALRVLDPSGLLLELTEVSDDHRTPWTTTEITPTEAIRGLHHVVVSVRDLAPSIAFFTEYLGFTVQAEQGSYTRLALPGMSSGQFLELRHEPGEAPGRQGMGTVHHVAWRVADDTQLLALREHLLQLPGLQPTEIKDRNYFHSVYCRMVEGVLFEFATIPPGFTVDETTDQLGTALQLPPWEEANRPTITSLLPPLF